MENRIALQYGNGSETDEQLVNRFAEQRHAAQRSKGMRQLIACATREASMRASHEEP